MILIEKVCIIEICDEGVDGNRQLDHCKENVAGHVGLRFAKRSLMS